MNEDCQFVCYKCKHYNDYYVRIFDLHRFYTSLLIATQDSKNYQRFSRGWAVGYFNPIFKRYSKSEID